MYQIHFLQFFQCVIAIITILCSGFILFFFFIYDTYRNVYKFWYGILSSLKTITEVWFYISLTLKIYFMTVSYYNYLWYSASLAATEAVRGTLSIYDIWMYAGEHW